jgi:DNA polymerase-1
MAAAETEAATLVLIDGNAMVHRAFHALPEDLTTKSGEMVNATMGFTSMLLKILVEQPPDYIAVAFDRSAPTFRHLDFQAYKAQRPAMPDHLRPQFGRIREMVAAFNIPIYEVDGFEADDVLGTLARQASEMGLQTHIVTGDMDTMQLVGPRVDVLAAKRGISEITRYDEEAVLARYGVGPDRIPDWKALTGDTSDNIPGVPGIGDKTATKLLQTYGTLEDVLAHAAELPPRQSKALTEYADQARKSKWLATIVTDAPVALDLPAARMREFDRNVVRDIFRELEFHSLIDRLAKVPHPDGVKDGNTEGTERDHGKHGRAEDKGTVGTATLVLVEETAANTDGTPMEMAEETQLALFELPPLPPEDGLPPPAMLAGTPDTRTTVVVDETTLDVLARSLVRAGRFAFDVETDSQDPVQANLVGISLALGEGEAFYIPVGHVTTPAGEAPGRQLDLATVQRVLAPVFADPASEKIGHNGKYDMIVLARHGMPVANLTIDTMVAAYLTDPGRRGLGLKEQAFEVLGIVMTPINTLIGTGQKQITMAQVPIHAAATYAGADADMTLRLVAPLVQKLHDLNLWDLFTKVEMPLLPVLLRMEMTGILVNPDVLTTMTRELGDQIAALETTIYQAVGHEFNINSNKQLGEVLFGELKLPTGRKTRTGYSVDAEVLENLRGAHPALDNLLEYRTLLKLKSTYVDGLRELINPADQRIHTSFNQTVASSGRLSSSNPNLQNIPIRTEGGRRIRRAFVAAPGCVLLAADYAQVELRILAHITHEPALMAAFAAGEDIHRITASRLYGISPAEVTKDQRRMAKTVTYAIIYGQSPFGLARTAGMSQDDARHFIQTFEASFPAVKDYVRQTLRQVRTEGYVQTLLGRKRFIPNLLNLPVAQRQAAEREAINMPIQGTNADIIKKAMITLDAALTDLDVRTRMILQVHDELVFEVPEEELDLIPSIVRSHMVNAMPLSVPLEVEIKIGHDWYSVEPME